MLRLPVLHAGQQRIRDSRARFKVAAIGRRFGKTHFGVDESTETALDGGYVGWFSPTYKLLAGEGGVWPYALRLLQPIIARVSVQEHTLRLITGGILEFWSLENGGADKARGREYDLIVVDESAMVADLLGQWDNALRPMLATRQGRGLFLSTPRGFNDFHRLYQRGGDAEYPDWESFHAPSRESPFFPAEEWEALLQAVARGELSAATFAQEYEAIFTAPEGLVYGLDRDGIAFYEPGRNIRPAPVEWAKCKWRIAGIDPGGSTGDPTGLGAIGITQEERHHAYFLERRAGMTDVVDYHEWLVYLATEAGNPGLRRDDAGYILGIDAVMVGETGGDAQTNTLRRMGWRAFRAALSPGDKGRGIQHTRMMLKSGRLTIAPAFRELVDSEVYVYLFPPRNVASVSDNPWATVVESPEHHGELLDTVRYIVVGVLDGYPAAVQAPGLVRAGSAGSGIRRVRR